MTVMHFQSNQRQTIDLGNGKIMRWSTAADTENMQKLLSEAFRWLPVGDPMSPFEIPGPNAFIKSATRLLMSGKSAAMSEYDFALVEDKSRAVDANPIVACVGLHRIKAHYGSVDVYFGKPELIATDAAYRNQGLVRKLLFEMIHPESEARGDVLQVIPGIPYFYRQFGYEYSLCNPAAFTVEKANQIPPLDPRKAVEGQEPFTLRRATVEDIPLLTRLSTPANRHTSAIVGQHYTREYWQYTVHDIIQMKESRFDADRETSIIVETATGKEVGFTIVSSRFFGPILLAMGLDETEVKYLEVAHPVLRQLFGWAKTRMEEDMKNSAEAVSADVASKKASAAKTAVITAEHEDEEKKYDGEEIAKDTDTTKSTEAAHSPTPAATTPAVEEENPFPLELALHEQHPLIVLLGSKAKRDPKHKNPGMRLYTRIPNYAQFLVSVSSELESRLAQSAMAGVTGVLRLDFFKQVEGSSAKGLELVLEQGKIVSANDWTRPSPEGGMEERKEWKEKGNQPAAIFFASFPPMVFSHLVLGHQSFEDLYLMFGDVQIRNEASAELLRILFPKGDHSFDLFCW
ncbi:hypothetical protein BGZ83_006610 [Gryganskiella cystojenkinii]|nr:hypothetical protein BGZ83_006610 [Gryganskiella cystojenkinii]